MVITMRKIIAALIVFGLPLTSPASTPQDDFSRALERYAKSTAHSTMNSLISKNSNGTSWKILLDEEIPNLIDNRCGYRELINLPEDGFLEMRNAVADVTGDRLAKAFSSMLSRPSGRIELVTVKAYKSGSTDRAIVVMKVTPPRTSDKHFGLVYQHSGEGNMSLCDVVIGDKIEDGVLYVIGKQLNR